MSIDQRKLGEVAAGLMDALERQYSDDTELGAVMIIAAVNHHNGTQTDVHYHASSGVPKHEGLGLLQYVQNDIAKR